jgi:hypothetical protein
MIRGRVTIIISSPSGVPSGYNREEDEEGNQEKEHHVYLSAQGVLLVPLPLRHNLASLYCISRFWLRRGYWGLGPGSLCRLTGKLA